jgi:KDO2-lipid IV(A) lauroyltransferase
MQVAAHIPYRWSIAIHKRLGRWISRLFVRQRRVVRTNLKLSFPHWPERETTSMVDRHFEALGAAAAELAIGWFGPLRRHHELFRVHGIEHLHAALALGRGVILYTGHFTCIEICGPTMKALIPRFAFMFSRRRNALLDTIQSRRRVRLGHEFFARDNVRAMLRSLRRNAVVWYAPDQSYRGSNSRLLPFFAEPAMTNTAVSKLAKVSGAAVLPFFYCRRADDSGYEITFRAPLEGVPSEDPIDDTRRLTALLEEGILACPEQYLWIHKKFRGRPPPFTDPYADSQ